MRYLQSWFHTALFILAYITGAVTSSFAFEIFSDPNNQRSIGLDVSGKWTSLTTHAPDDPELFAERDSWTEFFRLRLGLNIEYGERINGAFAYEQRAYWVSEESTGGAAGSFLPSQTNIPYRIRRLDWEIAQHNDTFLYRHEIDRALVALHPSWGQAIIGRQGIGLGRGVLFSAVDIFSPFSPLEVDREWRRGVDAVRIERHITNTSSIELIGAFGETWEQSVLLTRARGYLGDMDGEIVFGKRAEDTMLAGVISASLGDAEAHTELAFFNTPQEWADKRLFSNNHEVGKFVLGASYTFDIGNGLTLLSEYHYNGFGLEDIKDATTQLEQKDFLKRLLLGDMQILGTEALACRLSYPFSTILNGSILVLQSPLDGSGVVSPSFSWDFSQNTSVVGSIFIPWGDKPSGGTLRSEYGATPLSLFIQLSSYF